LIAYRFDLITSRGAKELPIKEKVGRTTVYRVGMATKIDKYLLPVLGVLQALKLQRKNNYEAVWGVMASYGGLSGVLFSWFTRVALLVSLFEQKRKRRWYPFYRFVFRRAHHLQIIAPLSQQEIAWIADEKKMRPVDLGQGWDYAAKKTKEEFQELEILTSRL